MIDAASFIETARDYGFRRYTGVPCSFLTPFINYIINDDKLDYISSANEGDALATAAGAAIGGEGAVVMMQNSGLGNAVSPITSLAYIFKIPLLIITTHRGAPDLKDEPQHELMGQITSDLLECMQVPWEYFPTEENEIKSALERARQYMQAEHRPYGFIMKKGTVAAHKLNSNSVPNKNGSLAEIKTFIEPNKAHASRNDALRKIIQKSPLEDSIIIATTGYTGRELFAIDDRANQLYMVGSMGCASSLGLGLALARPDLTVIIVDGDGAALMRMGNFATIGSYAANNLIHILLDNEVHDSTGAQATVSANVDFANIASACGYGDVYNGNDLSMLDKLFDNKSADSPRFAHIKIRAGTLDNLPRPNIPPAEILKRLMNHIGSKF